MQKLHQKQLQRIKEQQMMKHQNYQMLLKQWLTESQQLTQSILYAKDSLESILQIIMTNSDNHNNNHYDQQQTPLKLIKLSYEEEFTPSSISKLVFEKDLIKIKSFFNILPDQKAKIEHFVLIMMKVLFIDPSVLLKKEKEEQIHKDLVKQSNQKSIIIPNSSIRTSNPTSPKKIKAPSTLLTKHHNQSTSMKSLTNPQQQPNQQIDSYPYYIMSLQYMFNEILLPSANTISFNQLEKFIMGESISTNKIDNSNTQFKIEFEESKVQDFLLHFCGVKKLIYCRNLNIYLCLDLNQRLVKIYSHQLKYNRNYQPNTLKHNRRSPQIVDIWFVDFGNVLGLALADHTIQIINFEAFLTEYNDKKFLPLPRNYIVIKMDIQVKNIYYLQMYNRWLVIGEGNEMFEVNVSKYHSKDEEIIITPLKNQKPQHHIIQVLQIISFSLVCIVAGNEIWFYDEKLSRKKYHTYVHEENISILKFIEEKNCFYLCGRNDKFLTILKPQKKRQTMETTTISFSRPIIEFQIFTSFNSILLIDDKYTVRLISEQTKQVYQTQQYNRIVKQDQTKINDQANRKKISLLKISNENFMIYESYMVSLNLAKVPVETQTEFQFLSYFYFDPRKEELAISFNNQILVISLLEAQLRETYTLDNSNLEPLSYFFYSNSLMWKPFALSQSCSIFQLCQRQIESTSDNDHTKFKKKLEIKNVIFSHFEEEFARCILVSHQQLYQVKNDKNNTFTVLNVVNFSHFEVLSVFFIKQRKTLILNCLSTVADTKNLSKSQSLLLNNSSSMSLKQKESLPHSQQSSHQQFILELNINHIVEYKTMKYNFQKIKQDDKPPVILRCLQIQQYEVKLLLTDENVIYFVGVQTQNKSSRKSFCIKIYHFISPKVRDLLKFNEIYFNSLLYKDPLLSRQKKPITYNSLFLTCEEGFFIEIKLNYLLEKYFKKQTKESKSIAKHSPLLPEVCQFDFLKFRGSETEVISLNKKDVYTFQNHDEQFSLIKAHNACKIDVLTKVIIEFLYTISIGRDGFLKMWNQQKQCVINLKLPTLRKQTFDVKIIKQIRFRRMLEDALQTVKRIALKTEKKLELDDILTKTRNQQLQKTYEKIDQSEPIKIDIQNKDIEDIVNEQPLYLKAIDLPSNLAQRFYRRYGDKHEEKSKNLTLQLRKKRSFENILEKSSPKMRNSIAIPSQLLELRKQFQKYQVQKSKTIQHPQTSRKQNKQLLILPKLKDYKMQTISKGFRTESQLMNMSNELLDLEDSEYDNFEACTFVKNKRGKKKANELDKIDKEFIRKQFSMIVKKNLAKRKDAVQILSNRVQQEKVENEDPTEIKPSIQMIVKDIRRIKYESKYGGDRHIPKVKFKSYSQKD